jgi:hypothetical protein
MPESSFFLSFINPGLSSVSGVPKQDFLVIGLAPQDLGGEVDADWCVCLYVEDDIDHGPCIEEKQVRNIQIGVGSY